MINILEKILGLLFLKFPIKKKIVCFDSFGGQYNDNPKYISEKLFEVRPDIKQVWTKSDKSHDKLPPYVKVVNSNSLAARFYFNSAQVVVDNHTGVRSGMCPKYNKLLNLYYRLKNKKRKGQLNISTFHGTPLKHIAMDEPDARDNFVFYCSSDYVLSGSDYTSDKFRSAFNNALPIKKYGTPRNDIFFKRDLDVSILKEKLGLPISKKILLYAPTFRKEIYKSGIYQLETFDFQYILNSLKDRFGGEWVLVFRAHNLVQQDDRIRKLMESKECSNIINGNLHDDMAEYLACSDALVTDYSASMFDFALTKKPCFLLTPDLDNYGDVERGFYLDIKQLPFMLVKSQDDFLTAITQYNEDEYTKRIISFLHSIGNFEEGHAAERVVEDIIEYIDKD